jgi:hypothetical protein
MASTEPIDVARALNDWWRTAPFPQLKAVLQSARDFDDAAASAAEAGFELPVELDQRIEVDATSFPGGAIMPSGEGRDLWLRFFREWVEPWEELKVEASGYEQRGDQVLVDLHVEGSGISSGVPAELTMSQLWTVRNGVVVRYAAYPDRRSAEAALANLQVGG